ncbi:MAG TPA: hypothetical protein ACQGQH_09750 [Xylella sp.]
MKPGLLDEVFESLPLAQVVHIENPMVSLDSISVKVHPGDTGMLLKLKRASDCRHILRVKYQVLFFVLGVFCLITLLYGPWTSTGCKRVNEDHQNRLLVFGLHFIPTVRAYWALHGGSTMHKWG